MIGAVLVTHGNLGKSLVEVLSIITQKPVAINVVSLDWHDDIGKSRQQIERALKKEDRGKGVIIFTDIFGGTPTNVCAAFIGRKGVEIITGVNLPILLKFLMERDKKELKELAEELVKKGKDSIDMASRFFERK